VGATEEGLSGGSDFTGSSRPPDWQPLPDSPHVTHAVVGMPVEANSTETGQGSAGEDPCKDTTISDGNSVLLPLPVIRQLSGGTIAPQFGHRLPFNGGAYNSAKAMTTFSTRISIPIAFCLAAGEGS